MDMARWVVEVDCGEDYMCGAGVFGEEREDGNVFFGRCVVGLVVEDYPRGLRAWGEGWWGGWHSLLRGREQE